MRRILLAVWAVVVVTGSAVGQMGGGSAGGGMAGTGGGRSSTGGMQSASHAGMGSMDKSGAMMSQAQRRQMMHTTTMQDQKFRAGTQAMSRVQGDLSRMQSHTGGSLSSGASADAQQSGGDLSDNLSNDLQDLAQNNDDLSASLNDDQQAVVASKMKDLEKKTKEMQSLAQQLKSEMNNPEADPKVVREHMKKLEKLAKETTKGQHEVAAALGVSA